MNFLFRARPLPKIRAKVVFLARTYQINEKTTEYTKTVDKRRRMLYNAIRAGKAVKKSGGLLEAVRPLLPAVLNKNGIRRFGAENAI